MTGSGASAFTSDRSAEATTVVVKLAELSTLFVSASLEVTLTLSTIVPTAVASIATLKMAVAPVPRDAIEHVTTRRQFGKTLSEFDMVEEKIGWMVAYLFGLESMSYLTTGLVDAGIDEAGRQIGHRLQAER